MLMFVLYVSSFKGWFLCVFVNVISVKLKIIMVIVEKIIV